MLFKKFFCCILMASAFQFSNAESPKASDFRYIGNLDLVTILFDMNSNYPRDINNLVQTDFEYIEASPAKIWPPIGGKSYNSRRRQVLATCGTPRTAFVLAEKLQLADKGRLFDIHLDTTVRAVPKIDLDSTTAVSIAIEYACSSSRWKDSRAKPFEDIFSPMKGSRRISCRLKFVGDGRTTTSSYTLDIKNNRIYLMDQWLLPLSNINENYIHIESENLRESFQINRSTGEVSGSVAGLPVDGECKLAQEKLF